MFHLKQRVTWHGYEATIVGKTYGSDRLYAIALDDGSGYAEIPERQLDPVDNVVALERLRGAQDRQARHAQPAG